MCDIWAKTGVNLSKVAEAKKQFEDGFLCAPAVFSTYAAELGLEKSLALKIACGFGGGIGRMGKTCGVVTGALMTIGLKHGKADLSDIESQQKTIALVNEFVKKFKEQYGSIECRELIGYDLSDPAEHKLAKESGVFENRCPDLVLGGACILEEILEL
jgi:C_GCAxxG_C_C family probable redox protein